MNRIKQLFTPFYLFLCIVLFTIIFSTQTWINYSQKQKEYATLLGRVEFLTAQHQKYYDNRQMNEKAKAFFLEGSPDYVNQFFKNNLLLQKEKQEIEEFFNQSCYFGNDELERRYDDLSRKTKDLNFSATSLESKNGIQETTLELTYPVEVDIHDVKAILSELEIPHKGASQFIVTHFQIQKKYRSFKDVYTLHIKLLQREYQ